MLLARSTLFPYTTLFRSRNVAIHGAEIVRQLMIYAGKDSEDLELIDVSQIVKEMLDLFKVSVSKHAALEIDLAEGLPARSEEHTSELQSHSELVCRLLLE